MAGRHEKTNEPERTGSQISSTSLNEASSQIAFEHKTKRIRQENHDLTSPLPGIAWSTGLLDPIQRLPHEISTFIIQYTLLPDDAYHFRLDSDYRSRLLNLTAVSQVWSNFLVSTPFFWSKIYLDDRQPDFLATVATFVHLSGQVALEVAIYDCPISSWAGLVSILAPVYQRITTLAVLETTRRLLSSSERISMVFSAVSNFFHHLGHLPQLRELSFGNRTKLTISIFDSLHLPSTMHLSGPLTVPMPPSAGSSATPGRFFDIEKYKSLRAVPLGEPLFRDCSLSVRWLRVEDEIAVRMGKERLSDIKHSSEFIHEHFFPAASRGPSNSNSQIASVTTTLPAGPGQAGCGLEQFTHIISTSLCHFSVGVSLPQVNDLVNFLRLLPRLQSLNLEIIVSEIGGTHEIAPGNIVVPHLRRLFVKLNDRQHLPLQTVAHGLQGLFSVLAPLYPGVESLALFTNTWPFFASSYMESLRRLKYLGLYLRSDRDGFRDDTQYDAENYSITLHSLEQLVVEGQPLIHRFRTPNLLSLTLKKIVSGADIGISSLRKLTIHPMEGGSYTLNPLDYPTLCELNLGVYQSLKRIDILSFSGLSLIRLKSRYFTNPEGNHLCIVLLCNPGGCPLLQELHFDTGLEWDLLVLMLEQRNFGLEGVKRIHTVTLPFIPSLIEQTLILLLAGEKAKRPLLKLISLEATREVLFDPTVPGCCCCLKNMAPGCMEEVDQRDEDNIEYWRCLWPSDELYPGHEYRLDTIPSDIRDWMGHRAYLVDAWKGSYDEFLREFSRKERCDSRSWC